MKKIPSSEITPKNVYKNRRTFMKQAGVIAGAAVLGACGVNLDDASTVLPKDTVQLTPDPNRAATDEFGTALTSFQAVTNYNNFYEFSLRKEAVAKEAANFVTEPWTVEIDGLVNKPMTLSMDDIYKQFEEEERIYRLRCVETWAMVIPWLGFPLRKLIEMVEPKSEAKYIRFQTVYDEEQMPNLSNSYFMWPYVEGLRMDEAMNDLTLLSTGLYGERLLPQNGAPLRLVVPWKYGFKSIKSIAKIQFVEEMPVSFWMAQNSREYGFYANVNPSVSHPRWSQATEQYVGQNGRVGTRLFNGYEEEVAHLYDGMDLTKWY